MYFMTQYDFAARICIRSRENKRMIRVVNDSLEKTENDFNLTSMITEYKGRMQEKILNKMKSEWRDMFIVNKLNKMDKAIRKNSSGNTSANKEKPIAVSSAPVGFPNPDQTQNFD